MLLDRLMQACAIICAACFGVVAGLPFGPTRKKFAIAKYYSAV